MVAFKAADQACAAANVLIDFDSEISDPFAEYNVATAEFTAKYTGTYLIGCEVEVSAMTAANVVDLFTAGDLATQIHRKGTAHDTSRWGLGFQTVEDLTAGNQVTFRVSSDDGAWEIIGGRGGSRAMFARLF